MPVDADQTSSVSAPASRTRTLLLPLGAGMLLCIVMLAVHLAGRPRFDPPYIPRAPAPAPTPVQTMPPVTGGEPLDQQDNVLMAVLSTLMVLFVVAAVLAAIVVIVRAILAHWRERPLRRRAPITTDVATPTVFADEPAPDAPTMRRGIASARVTVIERSNPGDAIIAAWVGLEETAADSGMGRGSAETPAEFALRILLHRPGIEQSARDLLRLYEGVRFGGCSADETMRADAGRALAEIDAGWR